MFEDWKLDDIESLIRMLYSMEVPGQFHISVSNAMFEMILYKLNFLYTTCSCVFV